MICNSLPRPVGLIWGIALGTVGALNILDVLPDWTTLTAVLTLPVVARLSLRRKG